MTISGALSNAMSGLRAAGAGSDIVSSNIANALTEGYARRSVSLSPDTIGATGGVVVNGIIRHTDPVLVADRRLATAENANNAGLSTFMAQIETLVGDPEQGDSLSARLSQFDTSLNSAISRPDLDIRLENSVQAGAALARAINSISDGVQQSRTDADRSIATQINSLNEALAQVQSLNARIVATSRGRDAENAAMLDQRQQLIDEISALVPVREVARENGAIALFTLGGAILLDGPAATLEFSHTSVIVPHMTQENGLLSGLKINGIPVRTGSDNGVLRGGSIGAQFSIRDERSVLVQSQIDAFARDLIERFQTPTADPSLSPGMAGLFTDAGTVFDAANETGVSGRISINPFVDTLQGGETWRLRAGLAAPDPGAVGDAATLISLRDVLNSTRIPASDVLGAGDLSSFSLASNLFTKVAAERFSLDQELSFSSASLNALVQMELGQGVDTDAELQNLMVLEQAYAANARVIEAVDEMMQSILRL
jgi:flagellar hook-associated protein 1